MKKLIVAWLLLMIMLTCHAQVSTFRFAFLSDTHIGSPDGRAEEDLQRTIDDINRMPGIAFVIITGDITELGTNEELKKAKSYFDQLKIPYYIIPGNHDTGWSESGGVMFTTLFGSDHFSFQYQGIKFLGCPSGPYLRMSDGHVPRGSLNWLDKELSLLSKEQPLIFFNHYPIDEGLDNWYEITDRLHHYNTWAILCGHGHANRAMNFEDIPAVMGRSNLRAKAAVGGYNLVDVNPDSILFTERRPGVETLPSWTSVTIPTGSHEIQKKFPRPDYSINQQFKQVREKWSYHSTSNIISTPALNGDNVTAGNQEGKMICLSLQNGREKWSFATGGSIFSSPAMARGRVIFGACNGNIYCLNEKNGKQEWIHSTSAAVLGSPLVDGNRIFIGCSDHSFIALDLSTGKEVWKFSGLDGPVVSTPILYGGKIIFGAWDRILYALDKNTGKLLWQWNNGSSIRNYSPAACIPVIKDNIVYIVAPDRYITAIDINSGKTLWRNNDAAVRESIGVSENGKWIYAKTMQDTIVAYAAGREKQEAAWKMNCGFGYEHVPSMLIEKKDKLYFGTRSGVVYCIDPLHRQIIWAHKIDNSMVNTVRVTGREEVIAATMDGKLVLLEYNKN